MANDTVKNIGKQTDGASAKGYASDINARNMAPMTNKGGVSLANGDVVALDTTTAQSVAPTTTAQDLRKAFVVPATISGDNASGSTTFPANDQQWVQGDGYVPSANVVGTGNFGDFLTFSTTTKKLISTGVNQSATATPPKGTIGIALATWASPTAIPIFLFSHTLGGNRNNLAASTPPAKTNDSSSGQGYSAGSLWLNTTTRALWVCVDATASAAIWKPLSEPSSGYVLVGPSSTTETHLLQSAGITVAGGALGTKGYIEGRHPIVAITSDGTAGNRILTFKVKFGSKTVTLPITAANSASPQAGTLYWRVWNTAAGTQHIYVEVRLGPASAAGTATTADNVTASIYDTGAIDSTADQTLAVTLTLAASSATIQCESGGCDLRGPVYA